MYIVLHLPSGNCITNRFTGKQMFYKREELAYRDLLQINISKYNPYRQRLQLMVLCAEIEKQMPGSILEIFVRPDGNIKTVSPRTLFAWLNRRGHKHLYKELFKFYCDSVGIKKLANSNSPVCFDHYLIESVEDITK